MRNRTALDGEALQFVGVDGRDKPGHDGVVTLLASVVLLHALATPASAADLNDYPTSARADYVFGCMKANGDTRQSLDQCSCSIDVIASILPYERYVAAETVASVTQQPGPVGRMMLATAQNRDALDELRRAQAEAQMRCF
jgi:hypothetical protein